VKEMKGTRTVLFEDEYKVQIKDFSTTNDVDELVAKRLGKKSLDVVLICPDIISPRGLVIPIVNIDINGSFDKAIRK